MDEFIALLITIVALICCGALLRWISKSRWLIAITCILWAGLMKLAFQKRGSEGLLVFGGLAAVIIATAFVLPWLWQLRIVMIVKGAFIILWRRINGLAIVAEDVAKSKDR